MPPILRPKRGRPLSTTPKKTIAEAADAAALRSGKRLRVVSNAEFQRLTGYDRGTLKRWIGKGCPIESAGDKGGSIDVDIREVFLWKERQAVEAALAKAVSTSSEGDPGADVDQLIKLKTLKIMTVKLAKDTREFVRREESRIILTEALNSIRQTIMGIAPKQERDVQGWPVAMRRQLRDDTTSICREALKSAQVILEQGFADLARRRLAEAGVEDLEDDDEPVDLDDALDAELDEEGEDDE